jgi:hypothetical protein
MVTLSEDAQGYLDRYLRQVRVALRGHPSVDASEVERDVRGHIEAELEGQPEPIGAGSLREVLDRLGSPRTWVPSEELPTWRRVLGRLRSGPEDWRLAYLTFAGSILGPFLFLSGPYMWPLEPILMITSFIMARATLALLAEHDEPVGARRWLIYPILVFGYGLVVFPLLLWPVPSTVGTLQSFPVVAERAASLFRKPDWVIAIPLGALALGMWWTILGLVLRTVVPAIRALFFPFAEWFGKRHATRLALAGVAIAIVAGVAVLSMIAR